MDRARASRARGPSVFDVGNKNFNDNNNEEKKHKEDNVLEHVAHFSHKEEREKCL